MRRLLLLAVLLMTGCPKPPAPPAPDAGPTDAGMPVASLFVPEVKVKKMDGTVEVRRQGKTEWEPLAAGAVLQKDDEVRTASGTVELETEGSVVSLEPGTDAKVADLTENLTRYLLGKGLLAADATQEGEDRKLQVNVVGSDVEVNSNDGRFRVSSNGNGTVAVGAQAGNVAVAALGKAVVLHQGERTLVTPGKPPSNPEPLATSLLLKVAWPSERETNKKRVTVSGRTAAGALVFAMGRPLPVAPDGTFSAQLPLSEGDNALSLRGTDVSGNVAKEAGPKVRVDTKGASSRFKTDDLWKK